MRSETYTYTENNSAVNTSVDFTAGRIAVWEGREKLVALVHRSTNGELKVLRRGPAHVSDSPVLLLAGMAWELEKKRWGIVSTTLPAAS